MRQPLFLFPAVLAAVVCGAAARAEEPVPDFDAQIAPLLTKYCAGCHNADEANGELNLAAFPTLMKGSEHGPVIVPGDAAKSKLVRVLEKQAEPAMPPEGNEAPTPEEIALLKAWINAGAPGPKAADPGVPASPKIAVAIEAHQPITAVSVSPDGKWLAVGRHGRVDILDSESQKLLQVLVGHRGNVNDVRFSRDGSLLAVAAGVPGVVGEATLWKVLEWREAGTFVGHHDSLYAAALSPDGTLLATGSYDQKILIWDVATRTEIRTLEGHNGAVYDLAFHPGGKILASASDDKTVKLWDVTTGERLDTRNEPTGAQHTVAFSPDGKRLVAGGVDNRIRVWEITAQGKEGTNPILYSRFAHEAPILRLRFSADGTRLVSSAQDRTIKLWETESFKQQFAYTEQPDWAAGLCFVPSGQAVWTGRLDGTLERLAAAAEEAAQPPQPLGLPPVPQPHENAGQQPSEIAESEPNNSPETATPLSLPAVAKGVFAAPGSDGSDEDFYRFEAKAGQTWVLETRAARDKSPADTRMDVYHADGSPVERVLLRAIRDSEITFRPIDSVQDQARVTNWEEMQLNQFMYINGEVVRLIQAPRGPDSGFNFYTAGNGQRRGYFDTSASVHPIGEPVYIVEPYAPGSQLVDNGLPVFHVNYSNDDDAERKLGSDSRIVFTTPQDGTYVVRVKDVRGFGGDNYTYQLIVRDPRPDFTVTLDGKDVAVPAGSGRRLTVRLDRSDNFSGEVKVDITGLPEGFHVASPIVVQEDHLTAQSVIYVDPNVPVDPPQDASGKAANTAPPRDWSKVKIIATAEINGQTVTKEISEGLGPIRVAEKPKFYVTLAPDGPAAVDAATPTELVIAPGTTITAMLRIERNGFDGEMRFDVDNLPHGVIVDNIGLNGVMVREKEVERQIFLTAAPWVPETTRHIHAVAQSEGNPASRPITLHVRKPSQLAQTPAAAADAAPSAAP